MIGKKASEGSFFALFSSTYSVCVKRDIFYAFQGMIEFEGQHKLPSCVLNGYYWQTISHWHEKYKK